MFQLSSLEAASGLIHAFSEVADGNMSFAWGAVETVVGNRRRFVDWLEIPLERCIAMYIEHGTRVAVVGEHDAGRGMESAETAIRTDGLVTTAPRIALFLLTGDCLPIVLYDPVQRAVGLAHVSRLNATSGLIANTVGAMVAHGCAAKNLIVGIGPAIQKKSYIFPDLAANTWMPRFGVRAVRVGGGAIAVDLPGYAEDELVAADVPRSAIFVSDVDTATDPSFFSHRRSELTGEAEGRMATVAALR